MLALKITDVKDFMNKLLIGEVFDRFSLVEASVTTFNTFTINGKLHYDFFDTDTKAAFEENSTEYSLWHDVLCRLWLDPVPVQSDRLPKGSGILHLLWISQREAGVWHTTLHPNGYPGGIDPSKSAGDRVLRQKP